MQNQRYLVMLIILLLVFCCNYTTLFAVSNDVVTSSIKETVTTISQMQKY